MGYSKCDICGNSYDNRGFKKHYTKCSWEWIINLTNIYVQPTIEVVTEPIVIYTQPEIIPNN